MEGSWEGTLINNMLIRPPLEAGLWVREGRGREGREGGEQKGSSGSSRVPNSLGNHGKPKKIMESEKKPNS